MWLSLAFCSALLLGVYDIFKKQSLNNNAVIPVLFLNTLFCSLLFFPLLILSHTHPALMQQWHVYIPTVSPQVHLYILLKSVIVLTSWLFAYFSLKHLPITIASPIRASQPVLTLLGALLIFGERLNTYQWMGVIIALTALMLLSLSGKREGIVFAHNKWILFVILATVTGSMSGLYDKYLLALYPRMAIQVWYSIYQMGLMALMLILLWYPSRARTTPFQWRWSILFISLFLVMADFVYFYALSLPDSMISMISMIRRSGVIVSFVGGIFIFREKNIKRKAAILLLLLIGMFFLYLGSK